MYINKCDSTQITGTDPHCRSWSCGCDEIDSGDRVGEPGEPWSISGMDGHRLRESERNSL